MERRFEGMLKRQDRYFLWTLGFMTTLAGLVVAIQKLL